MGKLILIFVTTMMSFYIVSSVKLEDDNPYDMAANVAIFVENILNERNCNPGADESGTRLSEEVEYLRNKVMSMELQLASQNRIIDDLQPLIQKLQRLNAVSTSKKNVNDSDNMTKDKSASAGRDFSTNSRSMSVQNLISPGQRVRRAVVGSVAFSAYLTATNFHTVINQPIRFDTVLLNDGHGYNTYTGAFTAPLSGVYLFSFAFDSHKLTFVRLVVNGVNQVDAVANAHTNAESRHTQSMGGNTAIVHVAHGQVVLVETYQIADGETASSNTFRLCSFSGVLLY